MPKGIGCPHLHITGGNTRSQPASVPSHCVRRETMSRVLRRSVVALSVLFVLLFLSSTASAQFAGAITGVVKDDSGGVLPGVTVEATSPVLIEKARTVVTDDSGQ